MHGSLIATRTERESPPQSLAMLSRAMGAGSTLAIKPRKTDLVGEWCAARTFATHDTPGALSASCAIIDVLLQDSSDEELSLTPLFRGPGTGRQIAHERAARELAKALQRADFA